MSKAAIVEAAHRLDERAIRSVLARRPDLARAVDRRGWNLLQIVASVKCADVGAPPSRVAAIADLLIQHGVEVESGMTTPEGHYVNSVWFAVRGGNPKLIAYLIGRGARPCGLFSAGFQQNIAILGLLLDAGADIEEVVDDETPLLHCWRNARFRSAKFLLERGANPNAQDGKGRTPLHQGLERAYDPKLLTMLVRAGASPDLVDGTGRSPRQIAHRKREKRYVKVFEVASAGAAQRGVAGANSGRIDGLGHT